MEVYFEEDLSYSSVGKGHEDKARSFPSKTVNRSISLEKNILQFSIKRGDYALFSHLRNSHFVDTNIQSEDLLLHAACMSSDLEMVTTIHQYLLKYIPELEVINARNHLGNTCMHIACEWGSLEIVQYLYTKDFSISACNKHGDTPLHIAIQHRKKVIFDFLIKCKVDVNIANVHNVTPLHIATCHQNDVYYTKTLLDQNSCNTWNHHDKYGDTPLFNAIKTRNKKMSSLLLQNPNCDILAINEVKGETAANIAGRFQDLKLLQHFLSQKQHYPMKLQNYMGQTLVHFACLKNDLSMIRLLGNADNNYNLSEDINLLDRLNELTPLQFACKKNDLKLVTYFLNLPDSYPDVKSKNGDTVLHICSRQNMREMAEVCIEKCSRLARNDNFDTPLHIACYRKNYDLLIWYIRGLPDTCKLDSYGNKEGNTILHVLAGRRNTKHIIELLISSKRCNYNIKNKKGNTPLHFAFREGMKENASYLLSLPFDEKYWYNNDGNSPLLLALKYRKLKFAEEIANKCDLKILALCLKTENPNLFRNFKEPIASIEMPLLLYLIYTKTDQNYSYTSYAYDEDEHRFRDSDDIYEEYDGDSQHEISHLSIKRDSSYDSMISSLLSYNVATLFKQTDSHGNTVLHYLAMCKYDEVLMPILQTAFEVLDINSLNSTFCTPLHYACLHQQEWMIYKIFNHEDGFKYLNKKSKLGTPFQICNKMYNSSILHFLAAHGAKIEGSALNSSIRQESSFTPDSSVGIIVLGDSTAGKSTLINTLRMMLTNNRNKCEPVVERTTGLVMSEFIYYKNSHCYRFYDFGGQVEFEASHSVHLENLLTLNANSLKNPFVFLLLVKGTDSINQNKEQIMRWLNFVRGHVRVNTISIHLILICSHDDKFKGIDSRQLRRKALQAFLDNHDTSPLDRHVHPYLLNCTKPDTTGMCQLLGSMEDMFISSESFPQDQVLDELKYYLKSWFPQLPCQVHELIFKITQTRKFVLDDHHRLTVKGQNSKMIIPQEKECLIGLLKELYVRNDVLLLMQPENELNWWIVGKDAQNILFSKASSLFSPIDFKDAPHYSIATYNTGVVPEQKIKDIFGRLSINGDVMINYLINLGFCTEISKHTFDCIIQQTEPDNKEYLNEKLFFFPGLIKSTKGMVPYYNKEGEFFISAWLFENFQNWSLRFIHSILVHLTYKFTVKKDNLFFVRRIHLWKNGLFFCTQDQVEVLVEAENTKELYVVIRSASKFLLAKYRAEILHEIRTVQEDVISWDTTSFKGEYILYPQPSCYEAIKTSKKIALSLVCGILKQVPSHRSFFVGDIEPVSLKKILNFDPCIDLEASEFNKGIKDGSLNISILPRSISEIPEIKKSAIESISISELSTILNKYCILHDVLQYFGVS